MAELAKIFWDARAFREEAERARRLASAASGQLQGDLLEIGALYELLAAGKDPEHMSSTPSRPAQPQTGRLARFVGSWPD